MKPLECSRLNAKNRVQAGENLVVNSVKSGRNSTNYYNILGPRDKVAFPQVNK